jgi:hypothetical protein
LIDELKQRVAEQLLEDSSLTGDLDDSEARRLIEWALPISKQLVEQTFNMTEAQAEAHLYPTLKNLRRVMRRINKLVGSLASSTPDERVTLLEKIFEAAGEIPILEFTPPTVLESEAENLQGLAPNEALSKLIGYFTPEETHYGPQEEFKEE